MDEETNWAEEEFGDAELGDARRTTRLVQLATVLAENPTASLPEATMDRATLKAAYRFFDNEQIDREQMLQSHVQATLRRMQGVEVLLCVNDTMELSLTHHPATEGLGRLSSEHGLGLMVHSTEVMTEEGVPLGLLQQHIWARTWPSGKKHKRRELPIEQKESFKWLRSLEAVNAAAQQCADSLLLSVGDAESDVYELFIEPREQNVHLLARASQNRRVEEGYLWEQLEKQPVRVRAEVPVGRRGTQPARTAKVSVRFMPVQVQRPKYLKRGPRSVQLWAVLAVEEHPEPGVEEPLEWLLLSSLPIESAEQALECLRRYSRRFGIEVFHKVLKSGCQLEQRQLETAERIARCMTLYSVIAWRILYMTMLYRHLPHVSCSVLLEPEEWEALFCVLRQSPTPPKEPPSLGEAVLGIARLGGFLARASDGPPGVTVLWRGLQHLMDFTTTYRIFRPAVLQSAARPKRTRTRSPQIKRSG